MVIVFLEFCSGFIYLFNCLGNWLCNFHVLQAACFLSRSKGTMHVGFTEVSCFKKICSDACFLNTRPFSKCGNSLALTKTGNCQRSGSAGLGVGDGGKGCSA